MAWLNNDGLYLKYGTERTIPTTAGDFRSPGADRLLEVDIDIADLTTTASIVADTTFMAADMVIDSVEVIATTAVATITSLSVGLMKTDRTNTISDTAFVSALAQGSLDTAGETNLLTKGVTGAGAYVGTTVGSLPGYITAKIAGSAGTGKVKVRIRYRGVPPITH